MFGATFAERATAAGKKCLVLERRGHIGGNVYTEEVSGIHVHKYGAHIFHTRNEAVWRYVNRFAQFKPYIHSPVANYNGRLFNLPFNMNTFYQMWGTVTPEEAGARIENDRLSAFVQNPKNLEEAAINLVGRELFETLVRGYTEKQWGRKCADLPADIIRRLPLRFTFDNCYFDDPFQGIPCGGYTAMVARMMEGADIELCADFLANKAYYQRQAKHTLFTGPIDEYFGYAHGPLAYRSVTFEQTLLDMENYQGVAVMNYTDAKTPFTRIIEHKHFDPQNQAKTIISREYSREWAVGIEPYYPIEDGANKALYRKYADIVPREKNLHFGGRLGAYRYFDMDQTIKQALELSRAFGCFSQSPLPII